MFRPSLAVLTVALGAGVLPVAAGPGVAMGLDAVGARDEQGQACVLVHKFGAHVTLLQFEGDRFSDSKRTPSPVSQEVDRFLKDLGPLLPGMIQESLALAKVKASKLALVNGRFDPALFKTPKFAGLPGYTPGPVSAAAFQNLNKKLFEFVQGVYVPDADFKAAAQGGPYALKVSWSTLPGNYTPHMSVDKASVYAGKAAAPVGAAPAVAVAPAAVQTVTVDLAQNLTARWHR